MTPYGWRILQRKYLGRKIFIATDSKTGSEKKTHIYQGAWALQHCWALRMKNLGLKLKLVGKSSPLHSLV